MGKPSKEGGFEEMTSKLKGLEKDTEPDNDKGRATIKWK